MKVIDVNVLKEWIENWFTKNRFYHPYAKNNNIPITELYDILEQMPSAQPKPDEWCIDCKEYDSQKHCCPRFNRVIRNTLRDAQPVIRCKDCKHFGGGTYCYERDDMWDENDFCSYAERREE